MDVGVIQPGIQWDEIQRTARNRAAQRQQLLNKQYSDPSQTVTSDLRSDANTDELRSQRTTFTKNGKLTQTYVPKGTLFDKIA